MNNDLHITVHKQSELTQTQPRRASKMKRSKAVTVLSMQRLTKVKLHEEVQVQTVQSRAVQVAIGKKLLTMNTFTIRKFETSILHSRIQ